jgi:hypothetical protein
MESRHPELERACAALTRAGYDPELDDPTHLYDGYAEHTI